MRDVKLHCRTLASRTLALAGLTALAGGLLLLPAAAQVTAAARVARHPYATPATTVTGPKLYDPATGGQFPPSQVTVSQTSDLTDQLVHVSYSNFTPSVNNAAGPYYVNTSAYYAVMAVECAGTNPTSSSDCYEADQHGVVEASGPSGPPNAAYAVTSSQDTGQLNIYIETSLENSVLGCDQSHPCSLVIVPGQGGTATNCQDHSQDIGFGNTGNALASNTFFAATGACSWADRIVIPLHFAPVPTGCPQHNAAFSVTGSPMMADAMQQWLTSLCGGRNGMTVAWDSTLNEPTAVQDLASGSIDAALTTRPASADGVSTGNRPFVYAPIAVSAVSVDYWLDDNNTGQGQPLSGLELNQRLLTKLLTTSYNPSLSCPPANPPSGCDTGVDRNPFDLFKDPEFKALDPNIVKNVNFTTGQTYIVPTVQSGPSDMTWTVTRWIGADKAASSFLAGQFDPWGMHVNTSYLGLTYPVDTFQPQDPGLVYSNEYSPVFPLSQAVTYQALSQDSGSNVPTVNPNGGITYAKDPPEPVGNRALFAILDQGDAALNGFPTALIPNAAGKYVGPTNAGMAAALSDMISDGDGTLQANLTDTKDAAAYPLTMVIYAMVPTRGLSHAKAAAIARFLDFVTGPGQTPGLLPGDLPPGYLPLPASMRAQTQKLAVDVAKQNGAGGSGGGGGGSGQGGGSGSGGGSSTPGGGSNTSASRSPGSSTGSGQTGAHQPVSLVAANVKPASIGRFVLPALLILGALAALGGSSALAESAEGGIAGQWRRLRQGVATSRRMAGARIRRGVRR